MEASAAISVVSFAFQSFQGCVQAFEFFYTAQHIGVDGDLLRTLLEFEKCRLVSWTQTVGVEPNRFRSRRNLNWEMAGMLLEQLRVFLTTADQLKDRYALEVTPESIDEKHSLLIAATAESSGIARLINKLKPGIYTTTGKIIQASNGPVKRLRWATRDRDKLKRFVGEIRGILDNLNLLLDQAERESTATAYEDLIRGVISLSSTTADVGQMIELVDDGPSPSGVTTNNINNNHRQDIKAAAAFKQLRLCMGADKREDEVIPSPSTQVRSLVPILRKLRRTLRPWPGEPELRWSGLEFALYDRRQIVVQWKVTEGPEWDKYEDQMKCLAVLLMSITHDSFRSLRCIGYYPRRDQDAHGIVYEVPADSVDWAAKSLQDLIACIPFAPLARRLEIALALAETVLQLHTAGWMHKNLHSDNIIFLAPRGSTAQAFLRSKPYIVGYDYARPDTAEAAQKYTQQVVGMDLEAELYRHPRARGVKREEALLHHQIGVVEKLRWCRI
ncbi:prion-inhibition and propagation-domain-containing protein [Cercophora scortea]|uniref:Prion-inhibition and propagation-domain-containing protein n=1 Tax=Cercophora scortea TaxID=314031 RepID=A0AAE0I6Z9_9PEZI|nr:prion-inhibition and propagation-domain-containing protein [Cercophora scortea]